ncbi:hypothetical protein Tco_0073047 [Tanacetum coccineum]
MEDDKEKEDLKQCFKIVQENEVAIDAIPLATKPAPILIKSFNREDLETLWKLVKAKHGNTRPEEGYERINSSLGRSARIKRLLDDLEVTAAKVRVTAVKHNLLADLFTKALSEDWFKYLVGRLDMRCLTPYELEVLANEYA